MSIGSHIKKYREIKKLTQDELAQKLFVTRQTISNYENERSRPDLDMLILIADALNVDIKELIYGKDSIYQKMMKKNLLLGIVILVGLVVIICLLSNCLDSYLWQMRVNALNRIFLFPLVSMVFGWCSIHLLQICFQIRSYSFRFLSMAKYSIIVFVGFWLVVVVVPYVLSGLHLISLSGVSWFNWLLFYVFSYNYLFYGLFVVCGILFGCIVDSKYES